MIQVTSREQMRPATLLRLSLVRRARHQECCRDMRRAYRVVGGETISDVLPETLNETSKPMSDHEQTLHAAASLVTRIGPPHSGHPGLFFDISAPPYPAQGYYLTELLQVVAILEPTPEHRHAGDRSA